MNIVRITLNGYGCEVARGILTKENHKKIQNSSTLDNLWVKGLYKYLGTKWERIEEQSYDYGILNGDILITVDDEVTLDVPISVLTSLNFVTTEVCEYPKTDDVIMTTIQYQYGTITDILFITKDVFNMDKLNFIQKNIHNSEGEVIISSLISEIYYDGSPIPFSGSITDLRMSNIYFDTQENEKR